MVDFCELKSGAVWLSDLEVLVEIDSIIQKFRYYSSKNFGRILVIDNEVQHVEYWAPFYHEIIVHLPCSFLKEPRNALIIGGGSLFAAQELMKYDSIEHIDLVDHDANVIEATMLAYPERKHILDDRRLRISFQKYEKFLPECKNTYDLVVNDCFDLYEVTTRREIDYYNILLNLLSEEGICSDLIYRSIYDDGILNRAIRRIPSHLNYAGSLIAVPEYPGVFHLLTLWGKCGALDKKLTRSINNEQINMSLNGEFAVFDPSFLNYYLYLPPYLNRFVR
ncbi:hypothetical protein [Prosthecomicrobium hirschii]|uniref:spermine/spermidine synthase domain-containing protein n=1 Tax=Prosthecodimorpha hirschii TaxID=665126 RepID=UPI0009F8EB42|nr:hypothetical protein [Prosthecomicrobium hirschii]